MVVEVRKTSSGQETRTPLFICSTVPTLLCTDASTTSEAQNLRHGSFIFELSISMSTTTQYPLSRYIWFTVTGKPNKATD